jgi:nucleosome binding factor SPN SPT16 subunit
VLAHIRDNFVDFLDDGGWRFLQNDADDDEEGEVEDEDESF